MKKLLLVLAAVSGFAFAGGSATASGAAGAGGDCAKVAEKVVAKLNAHNRTSVTLSYSSDKASEAEACKAAITAKNSAITVNLTPIAGTNQFKFSK